MSTKNNCTIFKDYIDRFIWDFNRRDNILYNFDILCELYELQEKSNWPEGLNKPIVVVTASILEVVMYDFLCRIKQHRSEFIPNLKTNIVEYFKSMHSSDVFGVLISRYKSNDLLKLGQTDSQFYIKLEQLKDARNYIHIQKVNWKEIFSFQWKKANELANAEYCLKMAIVSLAENYPRPDKKATPLDIFPELRGTKD